MAGIRFEHRSNYVTAVVRKLTCNRGLHKTFVLLAAMAASPAYPAEVLVDRVLGSVDGQAFLYSDVAAKVKTGPLVVISDYPATEQSTPFERALQDTINLQLVLQKAKELDIEVTEDELDAEINEFLQSRGLSRDGLERFLSEEKKSFEEYKRDFRNNIVVARFQRRVIVPLIKVTDKDLETAYLKKSGSSSDLVEITLRQIVIQIPENAGSVITDAKRSLAQEARTKVQAGVSFEDAVRLYSDDRQKVAKGGLMEGVRLRDLAAPIRKEIERLDTGDVSQPVEIGSAIYIFKVEDRKISLGKDMQKKKLELENEIRNAELQNQMRRWLADQRQRSKIEVIEK
jgi:peptidyl-prolyl cis-trans isomerase SurA